MPFLSTTYNNMDSLVADANVHQDAPSGIISLSWAFLVIPCIFVVIAFGWIIYSFGNPSEFAQANGLTTGDDHGFGDDQEDDDDEKDQLLDRFTETQSHASSFNATQLPAASSWKISGKFSTTSRGGSVYTSYPDPNGSSGHASRSSISSSPKSKRLSLNADGKPVRSVGSKAAKALALNRDRMMQDLENVDPIDREELQRSSSRASDTRKSD
ncbi:uncharacterized protein PSANT_03915 [Moesziomyces antarcticus]|uniref:Uncharacterized protein n=2 Tax=Pseudozyma antarctica TaxID=84753 RepID=A0A5C3FS87_PSEA2|nr:uncharacterized protein PSANT_03915 [Moesziomyces antarcticus]